MHSTIDNHRTCCHDSRIGASIWFGDGNYWGNFNRSVDLYTTAAILSSSYSNGKAFWWEKRTQRYHESVEWNEFWRWRKHFKRSWSSTTATRTTTTTTTTHRQLWNICQTTKTIHITFKLAILFLQWIARMHFSGYFWYYCYNHIDIL